MTSLYDCNPSISSIGLRLLPSADVSKAMTVVPVTGDIIVHSGSNNAIVNITYPGAGSSTINKDNILVFDGAKWDLIPV